MHKGKNTPEIKDGMAELIQKTVDAMDVNALKILLVSVQKNNLQLSIEYAVNYGGMEGIAAGISTASDTVTGEQLRRLVGNLLKWFAFIVYKENMFENEASAIA